MATTLWTLPVPSTALLVGPSFEKRLGRDVALELSYETEDSTARIALVLQGTEAFKCTYYRARDASMLVAYDRLVDLGRTAWLEEVSANLRRNGASSQGLTHVAINFDDGPCYEFLCTSFQVVT